MKALFAFTIGPVKSFIENSRKMNDLYGGSSILSELTKAAIDAIKKEDGFTVIFPVVNESEKRPNIPNRFIAKVEHFDKNNAQHYKQTAEQLTKFITNDFIKKFKDAFKAEGITDDRKLTIALKQVDDFLEIHWLYQQYESDADYPRAYNTVFKRLQAVKNIRSFTQSGEFWGRKCTLFPEYNAIIIKKSTEGKYPAYTNLGEFHNYIDVSENERLTYIVKPKETLSAIAFFKRAFVKDRKMPSLRNMLLEVYFEEINAYERYNNSSNPTFIANAIYDLSNSTEPTMEEYPEESVMIARKIFADIKKKEVILSSYYACIKFDGDNMGEVYTRLSETEQRNLSKKICQFAESAKNIVEKDFKGLCVYAGGEDVLAFLPIHALFAALVKLHREFYSRTQLTFSAGIAIAHLMQPLKEVLVTAGKMEHEAKQADGKNAYAISVIKRSGETRTACRKFNCDKNSDYITLKIMNGIMCDLAKKNVSKALIYDLITTLNALGDTPKDKLADAIIKTIIKRIFMQKGITGCDKLETQFNELWMVCTCLQDYINCLDIIGFLSREVLVHV